MKIITPNRKDLLIPTLKALAILGGSGSIEEINKTVYKLANLSEDILSIPHNDKGGSEVDYELAWSRTYLKEAGLIYNSKRGIWVLAKSDFKINTLTVESILGSKKKYNPTSHLKPKNILFSKTTKEKNPSENLFIIQTDNEITEELEDRESQEFYDEEDREDDGNSVKGKIYIDKKDFTIREYQTMRNDGDLLLQPFYQRKFVIDIKFASRLIESIILDVPIPAVFLAEEENGKYSVVDGQQRLTSFIAFLDGFFPDDKNSVFRLTGTKELSLEQGKGKSFAEINDPAIQNKIKTTSVQAVIIKNSSHPDLKFAIFERLNTGSVKLNEDELRNTIYRGNYIELLKELEQDTVFHSIVNKESFRRRMIYRGMILRFFAITEKSYLNYRSSMKQFCNKEMRDNRNMVGKWVTVRVNMAIFDIQMGGFVNYTKNQIVSKADEIREKFLELMTSNAEFISTLEINTNNTTVLKKRFEIWLKELDKIVGNAPADQRVFKFSDKKTLFDSDPTCKICSQQILMIEDAEVDHNEPYSKGGKTELSNAQLTHRYCNRSKSNKS